MNKPLIICGIHGAGKTHIARIIASFLTEAYVKWYDGSTDIPSVAEMKVYRLVIFENVPTMGYVDGLVDIWRHEKSLKNTRLIITTQLCPMDTEGCDNITLKY